MSEVRNRTCLRSWYSPPLSKALVRAASHIAPDVLARFAFHSEYDQVTDTKLSTQSSCQVSSCLLVNQKKTLLFYQVPTGLPVVLMTICYPEQSPVLGHLRGSPAGCFPEHFLGHSSLFSGPLAVTVSMQGPLHRQHTWKVKGAFNIPSYSRTPTSSGQAHSTPICVHNGEEKIGFTEYSILNHG